MVGFSSLSEPDLEDCGDEIHIVMSDWWLRASASAMGSVIRTDQIIAGSDLRETCFREVPELALQRTTREQLSWAMLALNSLDDR